MDNHTGAIYTCRLAVEVRVGRKSRAKRERRERGAGPVARVARGRSRVSLFALLEAASVSPNASQYLPSLSVIYESLVNRRIRMGEEHAGPALLHPLIRAANEECPSVAAEEDCLPHDPRFDVCVEWSGDMFRMVAGGLERPTSVVETLRRLAATVDPVLNEHTTYGLADIVELVLRRVDLVARMLAPTWPLDLEQVLGSAPQVRPEEVAVASRLPELEDQIASCSNPERASAALEAHSVPARSLRREAMSSVATFGSTIAVRRGSRRFLPLPAGLMVEALYALAGELAAKALALDTSLDERWRQAARQYVGHMFAGAGNRVVGPLRDEQYPCLHSLVRYSDSQYLAVSVAAVLDRMALESTVAAAAKGLEKVEPGSTLRSVQGTESIPTSARLARLLIVAEPQTTLVLSPAESKSTVITLQDFDWIRRTIGHEEIDLWYFVCDLVEQRGVGQVFSWDGIDAWETWRGQGKSLYRGARDLTLLYIAPHHSQLEWKKVSEQCDVELALRLLGMGRVSMWPMHDLEGTSKVIGNVLLDALYQLVVCETPIAVSLLPCSGTEPTPGLAKDLSERITYKLRQAKYQFVDLMRSNGMQSLRIEFAFEDSVQCLPLRVASFDGGVLTFGCGPDLWERLQEDAESVEALFGRLLGESISVGEESGEFVAAWNDTPPGMRLDPIYVGPQIQQTPEASSLHASHRSRRLAELGGHLQEEGVAVGSYTGHKAKHIETTIIHPWLTARLHQQLAAFDARAVISYALTQLEYTNCHRWWKIEKTAYEVGSPSADGDRLPESSHDLLRQSRSIGLLIEEVLARPPTGTNTPTAYDWQELLSFATLASESGHRSEVLHLELGYYALVVSDVYEVRISESDINVSIDFESFARDRSLAALPDPVPVGTREDRGETNQAWAPIGTRLPEYEVIEQALQDSLGFGIDAINSILDAIIHWPVSTLDCTDQVSPERLAAEAHAANPMISLNSYTKATMWLSLGSEDFDVTRPVIEHWEVEQRSARIDTRPLPRFETEVWVLPWTAKVAMQIWVNYLSQYRMPRPDSELPLPVVRAFEDARQKRQRRFEKECASKLDGVPLINVGRVRTRNARRHGIQNLSGEIDILCIDPDRSVIFVIEAKDPFVPFSARSVDRQVTQFHKPGGHVDKLTTKVDDIRESAVSLAANKRVDLPQRDWQVVGIMVTRHVTPAAYVTTCQTTFCTVDTLRETILRVRN